MTVKAFAASGREKSFGVAQEGMDLRDWFAGMALAGGLEQGNRDSFDHDYWHDSDVIADRAYEIADAMMLAREKGRL